MLRKTLMKLIEHEKKNALITGQARPDAVGLVEASLNQIVYTRSQQTQRSTVAEKNVP